MCEPRGTLRGALCTRERPIILQEEAFAVLKSSLPLEQPFDESEHSTSRHEVSRLGRFLDAAAKRSELEVR